MIPTIDNPTEGTKNKLKNNLFVSIFGLSLILVSIFFTGMGAFQLIRALATSYTATVMDLLYFSAGLMLLFLIGISSIIMDIQAQNKTIAKGILHLLRQKLDASNKTTPFQDTLKNLFSRQPGMTDDDISGSISLYDLSNPNNPIFQGDFKNMDEMNNLKKNLMDKMLNSKKDFKGKKMTKQEMLDSLNIRELKAELKLAVDSEDWLWAASLRDKIAEKDSTKKKGNSDSDKKDNPEV